MTSPKFQPRSFCSDPHLFGRYAYASFRESSVGDSTRADQLAAAKVQHAAACRMRSAIQLAPEYRTIRRYAEAIGADPTRIGRLLRGTIVMRIEDLVSAERHLGLTVFERSAE